MCSRDPKFRLYFVRAYKKKKDKRKTPIYIVRKDSCHSIGERLGLIKFRGAWRQFVFYPDDKTFWNKDCLDKVSYFLYDLNAVWRDKHGRKTR
jgi:hypothetical protein